MLYGKSGYTSKAKRCFVGQASRGGRDLIVCVLGSQNHFKDAARLLDYGFKTSPEPRFAKLETGLSVTDAAPASKSRGFVIQAASFSDRVRAADLHDMLIAHGYPSFIETVFLGSDGTRHRVKVGYYTEREYAEKTRYRLVKDFNLRPLISFEQEDVQTKSAAQPGA